MLAFCCTVGVSYNKAVLVRRYPDIHGGQNRSAQSGGSRSSPGVNYNKVASPDKTTTLLWSGAPPPCRRTLKKQSLGGGVDVVKCYLLPSERVLDRSDIPRLSPAGISYWPRDLSICLSLKDVRYIIYGGA